jgi:hypothetical protein
MDVYLKYIYYLLLLSGCFILIIRYKQLDRLLHIFIPLYLFNIITQGLYDSLTQYKINTYPFYHFNQLISCFLLSLYYYSLLQKRVFYQRFVIIGFLVFILYFLYHFIYSISNLKTLDFSDFVVEGVFICVYVVFYLLELYNTNTHIILNKNPHFWISIGNLIFFSGCTLVMGFLNNLRKDYKELYHELVYINYFLNLLLYSFYIKAFLCPSEMKK